MKKTLLFTLALAVSFTLGFAFNNYVVKPVLHSTELKKVTGIGGIFFKCKDPKKVREWYAANLGINTNPYGSVFEWYQGSDNTHKGFSQWSPFKETTTYFKPSEKDFMINYRVADLVGLVGQLKKDGVTICDSLEVESYGKFIHIMDIEGNKIELWEPNDVEYEKMGVQMGLKTTK
jgi:predicted enzyme related to lactoylglutathione lyase